MRMQISYVKGYFYFILFSIACRKTHQEHLRGTQRQIPLCDVKTPSCKVASGEEEISLYQLIQILYKKCSYFTSPGDRDSRFHPLGYQMCPFATL
jgi:hypothetical protein